MIRSRSFLLTTLLSALLIVLAGTSCRREQLIPDRIVGKLVINGACGNYVVQVISGKIDSSRILASWPDGDTTYTNVFTVRNRCDFRGSGFKPGQEFSFQFTDSVIVQNCMVCGIYVHVPDVSNTVVDVHPIP